MTIKDPNVIREHRWFETEKSKEVWDDRRSAGFDGHVAPFSTLIAAMGPHWKPGCMEAVVKMGEHTFEEGYQCAFYEEPDRCFKPYDALGSMRNAAYMKALREGFEYILYVDNDVMPEPDTLVRMLRRGVPVLAPLLDIKGLEKDSGIKQADLSGKDQGLAMVGSVLLSFLLFKTSVFLPWAFVPFWENAIGAAEPYHFGRLAMTGHRPFLDTDIVVSVIDNPHFPLDRAKMGAPLKRPEGGKISWQEAQGVTGVLGRK